MERISIDQDAICDQCSEDRNKCEGSRCAEARADYIDDHGLIEDEPLTFADLVMGDTLFFIDHGDNTLIKDEVTSVLHNHQGLQIGTTKYAAHKFGPKNSQDKRGSISTYVTRQHAVTEYTLLMTRVILRMTTNITDFSK